MSTENNIIIAKFLGFDILSNDTFQYEGEIILSLPEFSIDWNWLMRIVENIESLQNGRFQVEIRTDLCEIYDLQDNVEVLSNVGENKMSVVYDSCVEFVNHWNNPDPNPLN